MTATAYRFGLVIGILCAGLNGCGGSGEPADLCRDVVCDNPPADTCKDASTLTTFSPLGICDPLSGKCSFFAQEKTCNHGCQAGKCQGPSTGDFELVVPDNTVLCTSFSYNGDAVVYVLEGKARVSLRSGSYVFNKTDQEKTADLITGVEIWPGLTATPVDSGRFVLTILGDDTSGLYRYDFEQIFEIGSEQYPISLTAEFEIEAGQIVNPIVELDLQTLFFGPGYSGRISVDIMTSGLVSCQRDSLEERTRTLLVDNGDQLTLTMRGFDEEFTWPQPGMAYVFELVQAEFVSGAEQRTVTDFFHLAACVNHHGGCCPSYVIDFSEPFGNVQRLLIEEFNMGNYLHYMDDEGNSLYNSPYSDAD
jgi:hypothetical protein